VTPGSPDLSPPWRDHNRYAWSDIFDRQPLAWPGNAKIALWVGVYVEAFRFSGHSSLFTPTGAPTLEHPDFFGHSQRDYGTRVGFFRLARALEGIGIRATAAVNSAVCDQAPAVINEANRLGWELIGHGVSSSDPLYDGIDETAENAIIRQALSRLREVSAGRVTGWLSPSLSESARTLEILLEEGVEYVCDWAADDLPFPLRVGDGELLALPCSVELDDLTIMIDSHQHAADMEQQIVAQFEWLRTEAESHGGRLMCVMLRPWVAGVPHRIRYIERALAAVAQSPDVWCATGSEIVSAFTAAQASAA
jgi:hypothetical protein